MGVKDLTATIKRYCPQLIKQYNGRWRDIRGSRVAIDGTLLTQRFYYGKEGHILSYLRLINDARNNGIKLIAVFDGKNRLSQKHRESLRREESRLLGQRRLDAELARYERLNSFEELITRKHSKYTPIDEDITYLKENALKENNLTPSQLLLNGQEWELYQNISSNTTKGDIHSQIASLKLTTNETIIRYSKKPPSASTYERVRQLLSAAGVPTFIVDQDPVHEGEALASAIVLRGHADYVLSEDTDVLIYGAKMIRESVKSLRIVDGSLLHSALGLTKRELIDFALLSGTDFSITIPSIGPIRALKYIKEYGSIENILQHNDNLAQLLLDKHRITVETFLHEVSEARRVYETLPNSPSVINFENYNSEAIKEILKEEGINMNTTWGEVNNHYTDIKNWGM